MARKFKDFHHQGVKVAIKVDDGGQFSAQFNECPFSDDVLNTLEHRLRNEIELFIQKDMKVIMSIEGKDSDFHTNSPFRIKIERYFVGKDPDGNDVYFEWEWDHDADESEHRYWHPDHTTFEDSLAGKPGRKGHKPDGMMVPYTEDKWIGYRKLVVSFKAMREQLKELLLSEDAPDLLSQFSTKDIDGIKFLPVNDD